MKVDKYFLLGFCLLSFSCKPLHKSATDLTKVKWIHGSENCDANTDAAIQVVQYNHNTWILRQNKCVNYEAPFLFLFLGNKKALLMDTGATEDEIKFPVYNTVRNIIDHWERKSNSNTELIVAHTHAHGDHTAGDAQFKNKAKTTIVGLNVDEVKSFFNIEKWPDATAMLDLGNRQVEVIPIPGHDKVSIALYDHETKILLSGDSFYPGRLYVRDWASYRSSIQRLTDFAQKNKISWILGNHIEMTGKPGKDYPAGTTFQPEEHRLPFTSKDLSLLNESLKKAGEKPSYEIHDDFIIVPKN